MFIIFVNICVWTSLERSYLWLAWICCGSQIQPYILKFPVCVCLPLWLMLGSWVRLWIGLRTFGLIGAYGRWTLIHVTDPLIQLFLRYPSTKNRHLGSLLCCYNFAVNFCFLLLQSLNKIFPLLQANFVMTPCAFFPRYEQ